MITIRHAIRTLRTSPGSSVVVMMTLAIAIAATTIIASTIDNVRQAIPAPDTDGLVYVASTDPRPSQAQSGMAGNLAMTGTSVPDLVDWIAQATSVERFVAFRYGTATRTGRGAPARLAIVRTTADLFSVWGVSPEIGRLFRSEDGTSGAAPVVLLSDRYWREQFSGDASAIGASILLDGNAHTIVGVLPREVRSGIFADAELFVAEPLDSARTARDERRLFVMARLKPAVSRAQAEADLSRVADRLKAEHPDTNAQTGVVVRPLIDQLGGGIRTLLFLLALIAFLVAAMACANVSNVVLAHAIARHRELSVRTALGAQRSHHVKQIAVESLLTSLAAGATGLLFGAWGLALLKWLAGPQARLFGEATLNWRIVATGIVTAFVLPLGFALIPAMQSWRPDTCDLMDGTRTIGGGSAHRIRRVLVAVQVALAVVLLVQITLFARTAWTLRTMENGFDPKGVLTFRVDLPASRYSDEKTTAFYRTLLARIDALPDVTSAGTINRLPVADREMSTRIKVDGTPPVAEDALPFTALAAVSSRYFDTLRVPIRRGRGFTEADFSERAQPVAVVSEDAARLFWPGSDPVGSRITLMARDVPATPLLIVGIVANVRNAGVDRRVVPQVYVPSSWTPDRTTAVVVRSDTADPLQMVAAIRTQAAEIDPNEPLFSVASMEEVLYEDMASTYTLAGLLGAIAIVALGLAGVGIYGVVSFMVTQRTPEIGLRIALGARPGAVVSMVVRQAARPVAGGGILGAPWAIALVYLMSGVFTEIDASDPVQYVGVALSILLVAFVATYVPARRAARIDPLVALRQEHL